MAAGTVILLVLGTTFVAVTIIALSVCSAICPEQLWTLPPERRPSTFKPRTAKRKGGIIDMVEWRPRHWR